MLLAAVGCGGSQGPELRTLQLKIIDPQSRVGVFLNEPLTFHFSADVDPLSVGRESLVVETAQGERARGELEVEGRKVIFRPDVPHAADLSDGGYRPGVQYQVRIAGFPCPDGIRAASGEPLARTERWSFTTVALDSPRRSLLFDDPHQEYHPPPALYPAAQGVYTIGVRDSIYLAGEKQIDPTSVRGGDFKLVRLRDSALASESVFDLFARVRENEPLARRVLPRGIHPQGNEEAWRAERRAALIELTPVQQPLEPGRYQLRYQPAEPPAGEEAWSLRDFSGRQLDTNLLRFTRVIQVEAGTDSNARGEAFVEDFVDKGLRTPLSVPDSDGTAAWDGTGRVEVHYPLAAGDGSAGAVALGETEARKDLQATSLDLAAGASCRLSDEPGLVVLRAQGRITFQGRLERHASAREPLDCLSERGKALSDWLARSQAAGPSWTIVIAGGDIVIGEQAEIVSDVPVLLVAGGQVRNLGKAALPAGKFWMQSGAASSRALPEAGDACFELDPPVGLNPLRAPLRYAVVSGPVPPTGRVLRWISAQAGGGLEPSKIGSTTSGKTPSSFSVHYFPADSPQVPDFSKGPTSPVFLPQPGPVRFVVELVIGDDHYWQTPFLDRVQLDFDPMPR